MKIVHSLLNTLKVALTKKDHEYFVDNLDNVKAVQLKILQETANLLKDHHQFFNQTIDYNNFRDLPISVYEHYKELIDRELHSHEFSLAPNIKYFKTTGDCSHGAQWIPYTKEFIKQRKISSNIKTTELIKTYPQVVQGQFFYFNSTNEDELFKSKDVSVLTLKNPLSFINFLDQQLNSNSFGPSIKNHADIHKLLPNLKVILCNNNGRYESYFQRVKKYFPNSIVIADSISNSCASITLAYQNKFYLAYTSHFFEFEKIKTKEVLPCWLLKKGDVVIPLITTPNGLIRYRLHEILEVVGHDQGCPQLIYKDREDVLNLVGEEVTNSECRVITDGFAGAFVVAISASQDELALPYYALIKDVDTFYDPDVLETLLCKNYHYEIARESKKLGPSRIFEFAEPASIYQRISRIKGIDSESMEFDYLTHLQTDKFLDQL